MYCSSLKSFIQGKSPLDTLAENNLNSFSMKFQKEKIILTGYRATGKSSIGKILADLLDFGFVDTDEVIEKRQGETIADMVDRGGWDLFRRREADVLLELAGSRHMVIATGGGSVLHEDAWARLRQDALVVLLTADVKTICHRLAADDDAEEQRPALTEMGTMDEIAMVLRQRQPLYAKSADMAVDTEGKTPEQVAEFIVNEFKRGS